MIKQNKMASMLLPVALMVSVFSFSNSFCIEKINVEFREEERDTKFKKGLFPFNICDRWLQYREEETNLKFLGTYPEEEIAFLQFLEDGQLFDFDKLGGVRADRTKREERYEEGLDLVGMDSRIDREVAFARYCLKMISKASNCSTCKCDDEKRREGFLSNWESTRQFEDTMHAALEKASMREKICEKFLDIVGAKNKFDEQKRSRKRKNLADLTSALAAKQYNRKFSEKEKERLETCHPNLAQRFKRFLNKNNQSK